MMAFAFIIASDISQSLGRLDPTLMSDQTRMEIALDGVKNKGFITDESGNYLDIESWVHLEFDENDGSINQINFSCEEDAVYENMRLGGHINFEYLPESIRDIILDFNVLQGTLPWRELPRNLQNLLLRGNRFEGGIQTAALPRNLLYADFAKNHFSGEIDLSSLPRTLYSFSVQENFLVGSLHFESLLNLDELEEFIVSQNAFTGCVDLSALPASLYFIDLDDNQFIGEINTG